MPSARKATRHLACRLITICAGTLLAASAAGCSGSAVPHASVSLAQRHRDDPVDEAGTVTEAGIYPQSLRALALNYMN